MACVLLLGFIAQIDQAVKRELVAQAFPAWAAADRALADIEYDSIFEQKDMTDGKPVTVFHRRHRVSCQRSLGRRLVSTANVNPTGTGKHEELFVLNERYHFELRKTPNAAQFQLATAVPGGLHDPRSRGFLGLIANTAGRAYCFSKVPALVALSDPEFEILRLSPSTANGTRRIEVEVSYRGAGQRCNLHQNTIVGGTIQPLDGWTIPASWQRDPNGAYRLDYQVRFARPPEVEGAAIVTGVTSTNHERGKLVSVSSSEVHNPRKHAGNSSEFFLPHYGISESVLDPPKEPFPTVRIALIVFGIGALVAAVVVYRRGHRNETR